MFGEKALKKNTIHQLNNTERQADTIIGSLANVMKHLAAKGQILAQDITKTKFFPPVDSVLQVFCIPVFPDTVLHETLKFM